MSLVVVFSKSFFFSGPVEEFLRVNTVCVQRPGKKNESSLPFFDVEKWADVESYETCFMSYENMLLFFFIFSRPHRPPSLSKRNVEREIFTPQRIFSGLGSLGFSSCDSRAGFTARSFFFIVDKRGNKRIFIFVCYCGPVFWIAKFTIKKQPM